MTAKEPPNKSLPPSRGKVRMGVKTGQSRLKLTVILNGVKNLNSNPLSGLGTHGRLERKDFGPFGKVKAT